MALIRAFQKIERRIGVAQVDLDDRLVVEILIGLKLTEPPPFTPITLTDQTNATLTLANVQTNGATDYRVVVTLAE